MERVFTRANERRQRSNRDRAKTFSRIFAAKSLPTCAPLDYAKR
jgi:hypothetical protein